MDADLVAFREPRIDGKRCERDFVAALSRPVTCQP